MSTTSPTPTPTTPVTVLGIGQMGSAIAGTLLAAGHPTTVWNRTPERAAPLVDAGAAAAGTAAEAVAASPLVVVCLIDYDAVDEVLSTVGDAVAGKALVNLTSGSPARGRRTAGWAADHGADYVDGGIMADPPDLGTSHAHISVSGSQAAYDAHASTLQQLGSVTFYGPDAGLASVEFMAQVGTAYEMLIGFLHTLRLVQDEGVDPAEFAERVADSMATSYPPLLTMTGKAVRDREFPPDMGPLSVQAALMDDLIEHRRSRGVDVTRMVEVKELMDRRVAAGHGDEGFSSLFAELGAASG